jgi:alkanesulfonate monooxygenase SsuD/methylene tetrahydromethanopterin reductase-like flavin-dependent oxidoreductase (luciferase family)
MGRRRWREHAGAVRPRRAKEDGVFPRFGIFDHLERLPAVSLRQQYEDRLELLARADALGFYAYHLAEHHQAPLCMAPSPSVFLAAAARHTRQLKLGALVNILPFYHPLRLIEELCMLDQLSGGRLQIGIGRGITAIEHTYWGLRPEEAHARQEEALQILVRGLTCDTMDHHGRYFRFDNVPLEMAPMQGPHPPFWSAGNPEYAGRHGTHFAFHAGPRFGEVLARYRVLWQKHQGGPGWLNPHVSEPFVGSTRHLVVADSDAEAEAIARASWPVYNRNFAKRGLDGPGPETSSAGSIKALPAGGPGLGGDVDKAFELERCVVGSPDTILRHVEQYTLDAGVNYLVASFQWGSISHAQAMRSLDLFGTEVIPRIVERAAVGTS